MQMGSLASLMLRRGVVAVLIPMLVSCYGGRSELLSTPTPPGDLYRCIQLELGRTGYSIVGADRASGWLHALRRTGHLFGPTHAEIYATVIAADDGSGSQLQLSNNSQAEDGVARIQTQCLADAPPATDQSS